MGKKAAANLLDQVAVKSAPKAKSSKNPEIEVDQHQGKLIAEYIEIDDEMKNLEARKGILSGELKSHGTEVFCQRAADGSMENFRMVAEDGKSLLFMCQDRYRDVSEEQKQAIEDVKLGDYVERDTIQLAGGLDEATQNRILQALAKEFGKDAALAMVTTKYKVTKGAIEEISKKGDEKLVAMAIQYLQPTLVLKK